MVRTPVHLCTCFAVLSTIASGLQGGQQPLNSNQIDGQWWSELQQPWFPMPSLADFDACRHKILSKPGDSQIDLFAENPEAWPPRIFDKDPYYRFSEQADNHTREFSPLKSPGLTQHLASLVDHVYIVCVDCKSAKVPRLLASRNKVTLVDGRQSDLCFGLDDYHPEHPGNIDPELLSAWHHNQQVTMTHKMVVRDAQISHHNMIAVFEADVVVSADDMDLSGLDKISSFVTTGAWQSIRIAYYPYEAVLYDGIHKRFAALEGCGCDPSVEFVDRRWFRVPAGCTHIHDSSAYLLHSGAYDTFFQTEGIIDMEVLGALETTLLVPGVAFQSCRKGEGNLCDAEFKGRKQYVQNCEHTTSWRPNT